MTGGIAFRPARPADAATLADIRVQAMRPSLTALGRFDPDRAARRFLDSFTPDDTWTICTPTGIIGVFVLRTRPDHLYLDHLYLMPSHQRQGMGRMIIDHVKDRARLLSLPLRLMALKDSPANGFYLACGFHVLSVDPLDIHYEWQP